MPVSSGIWLQMKERMRQGALSNFDIVGLVTGMAFHPEKKLAPLIPKDS